MRFLFFGGRIFSYPYWFVRKYLMGHNYKTCEEAINRLSTPLDIQCFMFTQFRYISDKVPADQWQSPERTWGRGGGDCEDWALFSMKAMNAPMLNCFVLSFYPQDKSGHATCVFVEDDNTFITMGTFGLRRLKGDLKDIPRKWYRDWKTMKITYLDGSKKWIRR